MNSGVLRNAQKPPATVRNRQVVGSIPTFGSKRKPRERRGSFIARFVSSAVFDPRGAEPGRNVYLFRLNSSPQFAQHELAEARRIGQRLPHAFRTRARDGKPGT